MGHLAIYGNIKLKRGYCRSCKDEAIVLDNKLQCCDRAINTDYKKKKRFTNPRAVRKQPNPKAKREILKRQNHSCFYCGIGFEHWYWKKDRMIKLRLCWDHFAPWAYSQDNGGENFVAACNICNGIKSDIIFNNEEEARTYVTRRRKEKGYKEEDFTV